MSSAGQQFVAGHIPGERIAALIRTSSVAGIVGTETSVDEITAPLVNGRTYRVRVIGGLNGSAADDTFRLRIREDSGIAGTQLQQRRYLITVSGTVIEAEIEAEYTAASTGNKVFAITLQRGSGNGTCDWAAAAGEPIYVYVDYIRG